MSADHYNPLVYNSAAIRAIPPEKYDFLPDDILWDETRAYARFSQEVLRGELLGATAGTFTGYEQWTPRTTSVWVRDRLGPMMLAGIASGAGIGVPQAFMLADLLFPAILAISLLALSWELRASLPFCVVVTSGALFFNWQDMASLASFMTEGGVQNGAIFLRTPYPQLSNATFFFFLWALLVLRRSPSAVSAMLLAIALVLNFYAYTYSWVLAMAIAVAAVPAFFVADRASPGAPWTRSLLLLGACSVAALAATPAWLGTVSGNPVSSDSFARVFGKFTHVPDFAHSWFILALAAITIFSKPAWKNRWFWLCVWVGLLLALNQQVVTGKENQAGKWVSYYLEVLIALFSLDFLLAWPSLGARIGRCLGAMAIAASLGGIGQNIYKFSRGARQGQPYNHPDAGFSALVGVLAEPQYRNYGFLTNDAYLSAVLPAYLIQKPLLPWYMDPLSDEELLSLRSAAARFMGYENWADYAADTGAAGVFAGAIRTHPTISRPVIVIGNKRRPMKALQGARVEVVLDNADFLVVVKKPSSL